MNDGRTKVTLDNPLPVELTTFTANIVDDKVSLNWQTATEVNNYGFNVERKPDTGDWMKVTFVEGAGNSNSPKNYSFTDNTIISAGKYYYRLKQIDIDGSFEYSDVVEIDMLTPTEFELNQNYPNPFNPTTTIKYSIPNTSSHFEKGRTEVGLETKNIQSVQLKVYNILSREITTLVNKEQAPGNYEVVFDASSLPSGVYYYQLKTGNNIEVKKMLLLK
jgi:hypothetical protein